jgi:hypothetical protein
MVETLENPTKKEVLRYLGGPIECLQLSEDTCLLINSMARDMELDKNKEASQLWWDKHPHSGLGADFIYGPALLFKNADVEHLEILGPKTKAVAVEAPSCNMDEGCEACGS